MQFEYQIFLASDAMAGRAGEDESKIHLPTESELHRNDFFAGRDRYLWLEKPLHS